MPPGPALWVHSNDSLSLWGERGKDMHRAAIHPCPFKEGLNLAWLNGSEAVTNILILVYSGVFPDSDTAPDTLPLEKGKPFLTDKFAVSDEDSPALC